MLTHKTGDPTTPWQHPPKPWRKRRINTNDMRIAVFEDDIKFALRLENLIRQSTHHPTVINTDSIEEIKRWVSKNFDPVFYLLDIVADDKTAGFQVAQHIVEHQKRSLITFITDYPNSIRYNPIYKTMAFSVILKSNPALESEITTTISLAKQEIIGKCIYIHVSKFECLYIPYSKIYFVEAIKNTNKLCIHSSDGQYVIRNTLKNLQIQLARHGFIRCHKSIIVNKSNIRIQNKTTMTLTFDNGSTCPYSYFMKGGLSGELGDHPI